MIVGILETLKKITDWGFFICVPFMLCLMMMVPMSQILWIFLLWGVSGKIWFSIGRYSMDLFIDTAKRKNIK